MGVPRNGWCIRENSIKIDDLGGAPFMEKTSIWENHVEIDRKAIGHVDSFLRFPGFVFPAPVSGI